MAHLLLPTSGHSDTHSTIPWWYSVVVSISGCDPLDPGSNPGTAIPFLFFLGFGVCSPPSTRGRLFSSAVSGCVLIRVWLCCGMGTSSTRTKTKKRCCIRWDSNPRPQRGLRPERSALTARPRMRRLEHGVESQTKDVITRGLEPLTNGLLDQRSTD